MLRLAVIAAIVACATAQYAPQYAPPMTGFPFAQMPNTGAEAAGAPQMMGNPMAALAGLNQQMMMNPLANMMGNQQMPQMQTPELPQMQMPQMPQMQMPQMPQMQMPQFPQMPQGFGPPGQMLNLEQMAPQQAFNPYLSNFAMQATSENETYPNPPPPYNPFGSFGNSFAPFNSFNFAPQPQQQYPTNMALQAGQVNYNQTYNPFGSFMPSFGAPSLAAPSPAGSSFGLPGEPTTGSSMMTPWNHWYYCQLPLYFGMGPHPSCFPPQQQQGSGEGNVALPNEETDAVAVPSANLIQSAPVTPPPATGLMQNVLPMQTYGNPLQVLSNPNSVQLLQQTINAALQPVSVPVTNELEELDEGAGEEEAEEDSDF